MREANDAVPESVALSRRLEAIGAQYVIARFHGPGNPMQTELLQHGTATATKVTFAPGNPGMNTIHGLEDASGLGPFIEFYSRSEQPCWLDVPPHVATPQFTAEIIGRGFRPDSHSSVLWGPARRDPVRIAEDTEVRPIERSELELFLDILARGFELPPAILEGAVKNQRFWFDVPDWTLFLAFVRGEPAGAGVLATADDVGYLASAATLPALRGQRVHSALIAARIDAAVAAGCTLVTGQADFGSTSQRNQQRGGLELAHVRQNWKLDPAVAPGVASG